MEGVYVFSRIKLENPEEVGMVLTGVYEDADSPYTIYVYKTTHT